MDDTGRELEPVVDHMGHTRWRVRVAPNERTCCQCGDTFPGNGRCYVCGTDDKGQTRKIQPPSVLTISYLRDEEIEKI